MCLLLVQGEKKSMFFVYLIKKGIIITFQVLGDSIVLFFCAQENNGRLRFACLKGVIVAPGRAVVPIEQPSTHDQDQGDGIRRGVCM